MTILLRPQREEQEVYPFRRVWRTATIETVLLLAFTAVALIILPRVNLSETAQRVFGIGFSLIPVALWYLISFQAERRALQPRRKLLAVLILGGLIASGIAIPIVERIYTLDAWLSTIDGLSRIVGYTLTAGITHAFLQYLAMRFSVWPDAFEYRLDGIAYGMATAIGYATALNLNSALSSELLTPTAAVLRITEQTLALVAISTILGYCLVELRRPDVSIMVMPAGLLISALLHGLSIVLRAGLIVTGISPASTGNNAPLGLGMAVALVALLFLSLRFLIANADERENLRRGGE